MTSYLLETEDFALQEIEVKKSFKKKNLKKQPYPSMI